jgi:dTMP kinase
MMGGECTTAPRARAKPPVYDAGVHAGKRTRGRFITIEGLDGCGKSTQLGRLAEVLRADGFDVLLTREPGGTPAGERIRALLLDSHSSPVAPPAELALMFAARAQHLEEVILPAVEQGKFVLCDRFTDSSEAYQGGGRKLGSEAVLTLHRVLCRGVQPDLTILMDSDPGYSVARARKRNLARHEGLGAPAGGDENRFEQENRAFFERVRAKYLEIARREPERVFLVDARKDADAVHPQIVAAVRERLHLARPAARRA